MQTTPAGFQVQGVPEYKRFLPTEGKEDKAFHITINGRQIALLYLTSTAYTLAWEGGVNFGHLEDEVVSALKAFGWQNVNIRDLNWRHGISVALVRQYKEGFDELLEYYLGKPEEYVSYSQVMEHPCALSFARYDFVDHRQPEPFFSFIAENAALHQENEVAIKLERGRKCTRAMVEWMITHHRQYELLMEVSKRESLADIINTLW